MNRMFQYLFAKCRKSLCCFFFLIIANCGMPVMAQQNTKPLKLYTQEELQNLTYDQIIAMNYEDVMFVADKLGLSLEALLRSKLLGTSSFYIGERALPYITKSISREEIEKSGASDLSDILDLYPDFFSGYDKHGIIGVGNRGIWGQDGRILIILDGFAQNDAFFSSSQVFQHYPASMIRKVEISRFPVNYTSPGCSQTLIVNITTIIHNDFNGFFASVNLGQLKNALGGSGLTFAFGRKINKLRFGAILSKTLGNFTDFNYTNFKDSTFLNQNMPLALNGAEQLNLNLSYQAFDFKLLLDHYQSYSFDIDSFTLKVPRVDFFNVNTLMRYNLGAKTGLKFSPYLRVQANMPWFRTDSGAQFRRSALVGAVGYELNWEVNKNFGIQSSLEYYMEQVAQFDSIETYNSWVSSAAKKSLSGINFLVLGQLRSKYVMASIGSRIHSLAKAGTLILPVLGLAANYKKLSLKLFYGQSGRYPMPGNYLPADSGKLLNESFKNLEAELAFYFSENLFLRLNGFTYQLDNSIYQSSDFQSKNYINHLPVQTRGGEVLFSYRKKKSSLNFEYAFYQASGANALVQDNTLRAAPAHSFSLRYTQDYSKKFYFSTKIIWNSRKYGQSSKENFVINEQTSIDFFLGTKGVGYKKRFSYGLGISNLLNNRATLIQPLNLGIPSNRGQSREVFVRFSYQVEKKARYR
jgi:hypothetical protein